MTSKLRKRSYDQLVVRAIMGAKPVTPPVKLGQLCVELDIPVLEVASKLGVARGTVYAWFTGTRTPRPAKLAALLEYLAQLKAQRA